MPLRRKMGFGAPHDHSTLSSSGPGKPCPFLQPGASGFGPRARFFTFSLVLPLITILTVFLAPGTMAKSPNFDSNSNMPSSPRSGFSQGEHLLMASIQVLQPVPLTVFVRGEGTVTSTPEGISCSEEKCQGEFAPGTLVRLHAEPSEGQMFTRWRGACGGSEECTVNLKRARQVMASFRSPRMLPLRVLVKGKGTITSSPAGLKCSKGICFGKFPEDTMVTLKPIPGDDQTFQYWKGACRGSETCTVELIRPRTVLAQFNTPLFPFRTLSGLDQTADDTSAVEMNEVMSMKLKAKGSRTHEKA